MAAEYYWDSPILGGYVLFNKKAKEKEKEREEGRKREPQCAKKTQQPSKVANEWRNIPFSHESPKAYMMFKTV